ncbi:MAG: erythromycin biosynthesis sensory transduction protein eryC1, partial [Candidatus Pacebacteria bacterium]|nr:erythromycin biosynthesis sensory transduction protein eryC1 [Candidatus Paceibacterota bacterium]
HLQQIKLPQKASWTQQVYHLFVIQAQKRDLLQRFLNKNQIETGVHYPRALPNTPAYKQFKSQCQDFFACKVDKKLLSLPMGEHLTNSQVNYVVEKIKKFYE